MSSAWMGGGGNIQISSNGVQNIKSDGYVTKKYHGYGCIDKNTLFNFGVVQGPLPNMGDKVSYEAQRTTAAQCWNATKVKVVQFTSKPDANTGRYQPTDETLVQQQQFTGMGQSGATFQQKFQQKPAIPQPPPLPQSQANRFNKFNQQQPPQFSQPFSQDSVPQRFNSVPPPMAQIVGKPTTFPSAGNKRSRFDAGPPPGSSLNIEKRVSGYQNDRKPKRSSSPPRMKRSYSRSRSRSPRRGSRSPRRKRSPRPRYHFKVAKFNLLRPSMDTLFLQQQYPSMYVPSDVSHVFRHAVFTFGDTVPYTNIIRYHVTEPTLAVPTAVGSKSYRAKVLLLKSISKTKLYHTILNEKKEHFLKLLRFWCNNNDKEITAFGGMWSAELDGADPENTPQTLINTAVRNVKSQLGIDLSYCKTWYKICEVHYHRISDKRNTEEHVERTVMFLPSIWDCQPSQDDWDILKNPVYKRESPTPSASPTTPSSTAASLTEPSPTIPPTTSVKQEVLVDVACSDIVDEGLEFSNISQQNEVDYEVDEVDITIGALECLTPSTANKQTDKQTDITEAEIKAMKVTDLRNELDKRGLSTKGLKIQLIARLLKSMKDEGEGGVTSTTDVQQVSETPTNSQHWKLQPEVQKRINVLITRLDIVDKDIPTLPDLASVVLHPSKGIDVQDYSLSSLVDYNKSDKKERVFEVSLFAETLAEMFQRHFALLVLKALIEADGESEDPEEEKPIKRARNDSECSTGGKKESDAEKKDASPEPKSDKYVYRPDLLLAFLYFDRNRAGYLADDDILCLTHSIGLNISRSQIKVILDKVLNGKSKLNYRGMCEKSGSGGSNTIQQETVNIKEIEEVLLLGTQPNTTHVKVEIKEAPETERTPNAEMSVSHSDSNVVVVAGNYVVRSELPDLLSKSMKKVSTLESKVKDLERQNEKLEKRIEESKNVKHSYDDLEEEVKVRKNELDILSAEKTKSELAVRKYRNLLSSTKTTLEGVMGSITSSLEEPDKGGEDKAS